MENYKDKMKKTDKSESKRKIILDAALKVFSKNGYHKTLIEEISKEAGVGKGTVYLYFKNKEVLFINLIETRVDEMKDFVHKQPLDTYNILDSIKNSVVAYLEYFEKNESFYKILIHEKSEFTKEAFIRHRKRQVDIFKPLIQNGIDNGKIKSLNPESLTFALFGLIDTLIWKWMYCGSTYSLKDEAPIVIEIISSGILNKGKL